ncbi:DNA-binding response regulator [Alicyclobacillus hesperidum subsp. aegles]|uniref:response regulator transcription factor n=1 Tax=Alicyclobacillus hesperidum TaxID=89784 RepID=UPI0007191EBE|nr:response regulator transcription factor [Alicyclobacillus hesperidum]KRW91715.1 response regulator [Alicyclobacillus tengchongensis]GLG00285.1 DNA-binding response regulator [Alicyclobacillus hesperidum subsp. aegles]
MRVLLIEDDPGLRAIVAKILEEAAYQVDVAETGDDGLYFAESAVYDVLIVDIMLPGLNGIELVKQLRLQQIFVPVLFLTARGDVDDRVVGLNAGADDYLAKPFATEELLARLRALLRRNRDVGADMTVRSGYLVLNPAAKEAVYEDTPLVLTDKEFDLLEYLLLHQGEILTRERISYRLWGHDAETSESTVDLYIHYVRKKLKPFDLDKRIRTIRNVGYIWSES